MGAKATFERLRKSFGSVAWFWSATENNNNNAWNRNLSYDGTGVGRDNNNNKARAYSVRCLRDIIRQGFYFFEKMRIADIYNLEKDNRSSIFLIRDGNFYRAYEHSALLFSENIADYHLMKRLYKVINTEMVYLGFPQTALPKILKDKGLLVQSDTSQFVVLSPFESKQDFELWKASVPCHAREEGELLLLAQERVLPRFTDNHPLHVYKTGYDCMVSVYKLVENMKRGYKYSVGEELKKDAFQLGLIAFRIAQGGRGSSVVKLYEKAFLQVDVVRLRLRLLQDLHQLTIPAFTRVNTQIEYFVKQLEKGC